MTSPFRRRFDKGSGSRPPRRAAEGHTAVVGLLAVQIWPIVVQIQPTSAIFDMSMALLFRIWEKIGQNYTTCWTPKLEVPMAIGGPPRPASSIKSPAEGAVKSGGRWRNARQEGAFLEKPFLTIILTTPSVFEKTMHLAQTCGRAQPGGVAVLSCASPRREKTRGRHGSPPAWQDSLIAEASRFGCVYRRPE